MIYDNNLLMVQNLDTLVNDWNSQKQSGKGYLEIFQETQASFGERYYPFGVHGEYTNINNHLISHFGLDANFFNSVIEINSKSKYQIFVELTSLKKGQGRLFLYGETTRDKAGRLGPHYFAIEGDYNILKRTFNYFKIEPTAIRRFVNVVFEWDNVAPYEVNPQLSRGSNQLDLLTDAKEVHFLDVGKGYRFLKKWQINWRGYNPDVTTVKILT